MLIVAVVTGVGLSVWIIGFHSSVSLVPVLSVLLWSGYPCRGWCLWTSWPLLTCFCAVFLAAGLGLTLVSGLGMGSLTWLPCSLVVDYFLSAVAFSFTLVVTFIGDKAISFIIGFVVVNFRIDCIAFVDDGASDCCRERCPPLGQPHDIPVLAGDVCADLLSLCVYHIVAVWAQEATHRSAHVGEFDFFVAAERCDQDCPHEVDCC